MSESASPAPDDHNSAVLELDFEGRVRDASKEWLALTGIPPSIMIGRPISQFVSSTDPHIFECAADKMRQSDFHGGSITVWATMALPKNESTDVPRPPNAGSGEIEAQGILVNVGCSGNEDDAVVWLVSKYTPRPAVSVQLPHKLARTTGFAVDVFAAFLEQLADSVRSQAPELTVPPQELCRICERFVKSWWFERHHWLCAVEHKDENRIRTSLDSLSELRDSLQKMWESAAQVPAPVSSSPVSYSVQHPVSIKHAVHVSSPLARSASPVPNSISDPQESPLQAHLSELIERCDSALELDPTTVTADLINADSQALYGPQNAAILEEIKDWPSLEGPKELQSMTEDTNRMINTVVADLTRYAKFLRYRRVLWLEVETQVREAIEATITAAESTDATVVIDQATLSGSGSSDTGDTDEDLLSELDRGIPTKSGCDSAKAVPVMPNLSDHIDNKSTAAPVNMPSSSSDPELIHSKSSSTDLVSNATDGSLLSPGSPSVVLNPPIPDSSVPKLDISTAVGEGTVAEKLQSHSTDIDDGAVASEDEDEVRYIMNLKRQRSSQSRRSSRESPNRSPHLSPKIWPVTPSRRLSRSLLGVNPANPSAAIRRQSAASLLSGSSQGPNEYQDDIAPPPSIRDYEIIKPISRGAYGVVYLARKRITNDLFAIKVLKKSDMVAKNQVTHIKHERRIMISTATSPYVATLYYSFQSRDFLYLVMEYVRGGDVAGLLKSIGCITESWAKQYIAEVIVALNSLHAQGILHRDLKPDNLLIDSCGHLKLSDFGLSAVTTSNLRLGNRSRTGSMASDRSGGGGVTAAPGSIPGSPVSAEPSLSGESNHGHHGGSISSIMSSPGSSTFPAAPSPTSSTVDEGKSMRQRLLGTPDYLAPETIEGKSELTESADWWSVGCIFFEFVYGYPPFNDETPQRVFSNILKGAIRWPELPAEYDISDSAKQFIKDLLKYNTGERLGAHGSAEVMSHPFLRDIDWDHLFEKQAEYIPKADNPLSTANFNNKGAMDMNLPSQETDLIYSLNSPGTGSGSGTGSGTQNPLSMGTGSQYVDPPTSSWSPNFFVPSKNRGSNGLNTVSNPASPASTASSFSSAGGAIANHGSSIPLGSADSMSSHPSVGSAAPRSRRDSRNSESSIDEFGNFTYRNLPVLERANNEVITKIRDEDRRLSFSGSTSPVVGPHIPSSPVQNNMSYLPQSHGHHYSDQLPGSPGAVMLFAPPPATLTPPTPQQQSQQQHSVVPNTLSSLYSAASERSTSLSSSSSSSSLVQMSQGSGYIDGPEKEAALLRVRRRQLRRSMLLRSGSLKVTSLNVLVGGPNDFASTLSKYDCKVVSCPTSSDVCLKANGSMLFDLILLDIPPTSPLPSTEVVRIIRGTVNPNRETPILQVASGAHENSHLPSVDMNDPADIKRVLKTYCNWPPPEQ